MHAATARRVRSILCLARLERFGLVSNCLALEGVPRQSKIFDLEARAGPTLLHEVVPNIRSEIGFLLGRRDFVRPARKGGLRTRLR